MPSAICSLTVGKKRNDPGPLAAYGIVETLTYDSASVLDHVFLFF